jgi:PAS domain S-box-containing protein
MLLLNGYIKNWKLIKANMDKRFHQIQELITQLTLGNFNYKLAPSESRDEIDALIIGVNMLGEELKVSKEKNIALFKNSGDAILIFCAASNMFVDSNESATKLLGFYPEEMRLMSVESLFNESQKLSEKSKIACLKSSGQTNFDTKIETKYGKLKDVSFSSKILPYGDDKFIQISIRDITGAINISNHLMQKNAELNNAQKEIEDLSKFPSENPNPILRFNDKLELIYNNAASAVNFLSDFKVRENNLSDRVLKTCLKRVKVNGIPETIIETRNKRYYSLTLVYVKEFNYVNIYAADITTFSIQVNENEKKLIGLNDEIENQKQFYELILNSLPSDVVVFDKKHRYLFINPKGIKNQETRKFMIGKDDFDYSNFKGISDEKAVLRRKLFNKVIKTKNHETWTDEFILENGNRKVVQRSLGPIFDENGKLCFVIGYGVDITKRIQTEEENMKLSLVAKNTNNGVLVLNENRDITWANTAFLERSGYLLSEIIGKNATYYLFDKKSVPLDHKVIVAMDNRRKVSVELMRRSKDNKEYWVDLNVQPLFDNTHKLSGFMFVEFDVTDRIVNEQTIRNLNMDLENIVQKKTEKLSANELKLENSLRKEQERTIALITSENKLKTSLIKEKELGQLKESFVTVASHQFRTPLSVIQSNAELLEMLNKLDQKQDTVKYAKVTNRITMAISKMTDLMDDLLTLGKLTSGKVSYNPESFDVVKFCDNLVQEFNIVQVDGRSIDFIVLGKPSMVFLDAKLLEHTLSNLISNAFKYSLGKENPQLSLEFTETELFLSIKDFGLGIPKEEQLNLFEPFFRADNVTEIQGTGLGLSIAKEYVQVNKGVIKAESVLGEGSSFQIIFNVG